MRHFLRMAFATATCAACSLLAVAPARADPVTDWNSFALERFAAAKMPAGAPLRATAMLHAAIFEAVNSIEPRYAPYAAALPGAKGASQMAAVCAAASAILLSLVPEQAEPMKARTKACLDKVADGAEKAEGVRVGQTAGTAILAGRANDGADFSDSYTPGSGPGVYAPLSLPVAAPHFASMKPFVLASADALRPPPPPALGSAQAERDLAETRALGGGGSALRTAAQTAQAHYFASPARIVWNAIARQAVEAGKLDLVDSARVMALVNFALSDSSSAVWDAKYFYNAWRPQTALQTAEPGWQPLEPDPLHPEYPCAHCGVGSAASFVLQALFGNGPVEFEVRAGPGGETRIFTSFRQFQTEEAQSRIYIGAHFRWSVMVGEMLGRQVGEQVMEALRPVK